MRMIKPRALKKGGTIGLVGISGAMHDRETHFDRMLAAIDALGFRVIVADSCREQYGYLSGSDASRARGLNQMFADDRVDAVVCMRGGYGVHRMLDLVDFDVIRANPKPLLGYSDITALHTAIHEKAHMVTLHGPMPSTDWVDMPPFTRESLLRALTSTQPLGPVKNPPDIRPRCTVPGRCVTAIQPANDEEGVVIVRRHPDARTHRQMVLVGPDGTELDSVTLPARMVPMEACYGPSGFAFSFESIYNYGDGIANLGTYTPQAKPDSGQYSSRSWFHFTRTPSMPPAWCDGWFMVKSTSAVVGIDLQSKRYTIFSTDNNAEIYGDCLASQGSNGTVVIFTNIDRTAAVQDHEDVTDDDKLCNVRVYTTKENAGNFSSSEDSGEEEWDEEWE